MYELLAYLAKDANLTNALATVTSAIIALAALTISMVSLYVSHATLKIQRRHNVLSVKPIPMVSVADYEDRLTVKILNNGSGPLIIKDVQVKKESQVRESLVDWMPSLPDGMYWATFAGPVKNRSILPGNEIKLLELNGDHSEKKFKEVRDNCRAALCQLTVVLEYTDVYGSAFEFHEKQLSWFGRNLSASSN
ncbi:MAG: hypothetical protein A3G96_03385 [Gammaproteobacteria bacterium RIFCSPLOWO2_12_FULL_52_10]|nr:MAG: hypothetical protein A3G96_03385 [Gammaproteobacteria bacterium RIFCSPLOWO2_12_FULL_52_10]